MRQELLQQYLQHRREIRDILNEMAMDLPHYHNLEWRFDVQVGLQTNPEIVYTCFSPYTATSVLVFVSLDTVQTKAQ